jgi:hypothetical protein
MNFRNLGFLALEMCPPAWSQFHVNRGLATTPTLEEAAGEVHPELLAFARARQRELRAAYDREMAQRRGPKPAPTSGRKR